MTRWWLFRACNNPVPADNGSGDTQQQVVGCCNHCCGNARDKGPSNKCCTPTIPVSSPSNNNNKTTNNSTLLLHQNTSQQCESVRIMFNSVLNKIIIKVFHTYYYYHNQRVRTSATVIVIILHLSGFVWRISFRCNFITTIQRRGVLAFYWFMGLLPRKCTSLYN